ncbi:MAG: site-specific integrase [Verrucomicrobia bacterium]|jgi:integrase|nr:site-specific integrase [Verrucomicrobiota bacterium]
MKSRKRKLTRDKRNGQYFVRFQVDGVRKYFMLGTNRKNAQAELVRLERLHDAGELDTCLAQEEPPVSLAVVTDPNEIKLKEVIDLHVDWMCANRAEGTCNVRVHYLKHFLRYTGNCLVSSIDKLLLSSFYGWARKYHSSGPNGGNVFLRNVKSMFLWAEDMDICPCPVRRFPFVREAPPETKRFTDDELSALLTCVKPVAPDFHDLILFAVLTGLRPQELRDLRRKHFKNDQPGKEYLKFEEHKTAKMTTEPAKRTVPLVPQAVSIILRQIADHPETEYIFTNTIGRPYTATVLRQRLGRWCARACIKPRPPYALRHTFGSMEAEARVNQTVIAQIMGHTQLRTTARYIAHNEEHHRKSIGYVCDRLNKITNGNGTTPEAPGEETE